MAKQLVCPDCKSDGLRSWEAASIGYPITAAVDDAGKRGTEYTGESYVVGDEGTVFADDIWCGCGWSGGLAQLVEVDS
jgi:hypothetical protein